MSEPEDVLVEEAARKSDLPPEKRIYFNGFLCTLTPADAFITLQVGLDQVAVVYASHTVIKTLAIKLGELVSALEKSTESQILTTDDVARAMSKLRAKE